jgi:fructose/tagatose bisphosphate aldolase
MWKHFSRRSKKEPGGLESGSLCMSCGIVKKNNLSEQRRVLLSQMNAFAKKKKKGSKLSKSFKKVVKRLSKNCQKSVKKFETSRRQKTF